MAGKGKNGLTSAELSSFCSQIALILSAGLPLYDGMETLAETTKGTEYADLYEKAYKGVNETGSLYESLKSDGRWPTYLVEMAGIGEGGRRRRGRQRMRRLDSILGQTVDFELYVQNLWK